MSVEAFYALPEEERDYWIADYEIQLLTCRDCGNPMDKCSDPKRVWYPYRRVCYATMEREAALQAYLHRHGEGAGWHDGTFTSWVAERSDTHPYPADAGVIITVADRDLAPHDKFTTERDASPVPPSAGEQQEPAGRHGDGDDQ